jgi:hypothetical protein
MSKEKFQMPFLSNSKQMMLEFVKESRRLSSLHPFFQSFSTLEMQRIYMKCFSKGERRYLEDNWRKLGLIEMLRTKYPYERLPVDWFRDNG